MTFYPRHSYDTPKEKMLENPRSERIEFGNHGYAIHDGEGNYESYCNYRYDVPVGTFRSVKEARYASYKEALEQHENWQGALWGAV